MYLLMLVSDVTFEESMLMSVSFSVFLHRSSDGVSEGLK